MTPTSNDLNQLLESVAKSLDISPTDYDRAVRSYSAVGKWLEEGAYPGSTSKPSIYPQGSINLGTIVRPWRDGKEADFDVDLVCEVQMAKGSTTPKSVKNMVGARLKENTIYADKMEPEGKRCWTLTYAESAGLGFHIDVLPCVPDIATFRQYFRGYIAITHKHKDSGMYEWKPSNPKGYAEWFKERNTVFEKMASVQKKFLFESIQARAKGKAIYASVKDIPDQLVRTPLQRVVQLMKRHRDMRFAKTPDIKPISMIITTVAASLYSGQEDVYSALIDIVEQMGLHRGLVENWHATLNEKIASRRLITRKADGTWEIQNPTCPGENFADKWHEDNNARAKAFFNWVAWLQDDVLKIPTRKGLSAVADYLTPLFGERPTKDAISRWGESLRMQRESGNLKMQSGTGLLGAAGAITTGSHSFYGK